MLRPSKPHGLANQGERVRRRLDPRCPAAAVPVIAIMRVGVREHLKMPGLQPSPHSFSAARVAKAARPRLHPRR